MKPNPPADRRKFTTEWDEIGYLYDKLLYWLYQRADPGKARVFADRLERLLSRVPASQEAIFGEECWSLVYEAKGDYPKAIEHRENEIRLIRRLHDIAADEPHRDLALKDYGLEDLSDRLDLLATLYHDSGHLDKALTILRESRQLCEDSGLTFDGEDLLREYLAEKETCCSRNLNHDRKDSRSASASAVSRRD
jgi:tetratricopeptide (TPR) repeat protein